MDLRHWGLDRDPFPPTSGPFVAIPGHVEAVHRLLDAIDSGRPLVVLSAGAGMGKSTVLRRALLDARRADRRVATTRSPIDASSLWRDLGDRLAGEVSAVEDARTAADWRRLERAVKVCTLQGRRAILAVDGCENLSAEESREFGRLARLDGATSILVFQDQEDDTPDLTKWGPPIRLSPLTSSEAGGYLVEKLVNAGGAGDLLTPRAVVRLHAAARGIPARLDRLASAAMGLAASRGLEAVSSEVVDEVSMEVPLMTDWRG